MNDGDWKILRWMADHRIITGLLTIAVFAYGLYGCWPSITEELPRFDPWHRWLLWIGDAAALLAVIPWMFRPPVKGQAFDYASAVKRATIVIMVAITVDVVVTMSGLVSEKTSSLRSVPAVATVTGKSSHVVRLSEPKTYYEIEFQFQDVAGNPQTGRLEFSQFGDDKLPGWKTKLLGVFEDDAKTIDIVYDPQRPARVWAKDQAWGHGVRLGMLCMCIHLFQIFMLGGFMYHVLINKTHEAFSPEISQVTPVLPLVVEAILLAFIGSFALYLGSLA